MAIDTYGNLKTAVANWLHRTDLTSVIPDFVALAEARIRTDVRCRAMEATASGDLASDTLALPARFAEARRVTLSDRVLTYTPPTSFKPRRFWADGVYTITGTDFVFPASTGAYEVQYFAWFAPFSDDGDTNTLLTNHPDVYLFATLAEARGYIGGDPLPDLARYERAVQKVRVMEQQRAFAGPLMVRVEGSANGYVP